MEDIVTRITAWPTGQQDEVRARIAAHRAADEIVQGTGYRDGRGCAVGCALDNYDHEEYARVLGIPLQVAYLVDEIHEGLSPEDSLAWPGRVVHALRPGANTTHVWSRFAIWLLTVENPSESGAVVAALCSRRIDNDEPTPEEWAAAVAATVAEAKAVARAVERAAAGAEAVAATVMAAKAKARAAARVTAGVETVTAARAVAAAMAAAARAASARYADALIAILEGCPDADVETSQ